MRFLQPLGWLLALLLPLIVVLHFQKQQVVEKKVSYLRIWDQVIQEIEGAKSRKINRYLLLLLQLLIGLFIVVAFARPIWVSDFQGEKVTVALDCSMSMQSEEQDYSRFEKAKQELENYLKEMPQNVKIDLVLLKSTSKVILKDAGKNEVKEKINTINCTNEILDMEKAVDVLSSASCPIIVISDKELPFGDRQIHIGGSLENLGITSGVYDYYSQTALCRVKNYCSKSQTVVLQMKDEQGRREVQKLDIPPFAEVDANWTYISPETKILEFSIQESDMLPVDNTFLLPMGKEYQKKILLVGDDYYLEKALSSIPYINVEKRKQINHQNQKYDLIIMQKDYQAERDFSKNNVWYLIPPEEKIVEEKVGQAEPIILSNLLTKNLDLSNYSGEYETIIAENDEEVLMTAMGEPLIVMGNNKEGKYLYSALKWHNSSLPLLPQFPILVENIINCFFTRDDNQYQSGDYLYPIEGRKMKIVGPTGSKETLEKVPLILDTPGIYQITIDDDPVQSLIVNPPSGILCNEAKITEEMLSNNKETNFTGNIKLPSSVGLMKGIVMLVLVLLVVEWQVFKGEN